MRSSALRWFLLSVVLIGAGAWFWRLGEQKRLAAPIIVSHPAPATTATVAPHPVAKARNSLLLSNTSEDAATLSRKDRAILLRNALIDTTLPLTMDIPDALRATNGRSFVVQSPHPLDNAFYQSLAAAGAKYISYIPNNAALVEASAQAAASLTNYTVVPYEPYYKLASDLLPN